MALGDPYATTAELKARLGLSTTKPSEDTRLLGAVTAATQEVEQFCVRQFNSSGSASERSFVASSRFVVFTDDFHVAPTSVVVVEQAGGLTTTTTLSAADWQAEPLESRRAGFAVPAPQWRLRNLSGVAWPVRGAGYLKVTATWGWASVPGAVKEATLLMAEEYYKLKEAPFGVVNWGEFGPIRVTHNRRAMGLLKHYARGRMKVG